ncbi:MAG: coproporphyrinogen dehydrogenase HemZ [Christensenellaceae bacterium]|jgi:oxygen-independent coproporphyrinogen-3 oxidase|nr:coproporphyrinogen dehydrogenase HemZ [Christensenellaceae bacterium]
MVTLHTNRPDFFNDIAEEIRLFFDMAEVRLAEPGLCEGEAVITAMLNTAGDPWQGLADVRLLDGRSAAYTEGYPAALGSALVQKRHQKRCMKIAVFRALRQLFPNAHLPWGSLTGIRPTRLLRELVALEGPEGAKQTMLNTFDVSPDKLRLAAEILAAQQSVFAAQTPQDLDVYIGIPFCASRCLYCSFASEVRTAKTDMSAYLAALKRDIALGAAIAREGGYRIRSMYVGGGTPTVLTCAELADLLRHALSCYGGFGLELTVEAGRPDTIDRQKLELLRGMGVSRISINPQTMNAATLERIGRAHTPQDSCACYALAREVGFDCVNMDIIVGLPGENLDDVRRTLSAIAAFPTPPENLTVHTLAVKRSSQLKRRLDEFPLPPSAEAEEMVRQSRFAAAGMGMAPYYMYRQKYMRGNLENVGYARPHKLCVYNVDMMEETTSIMAHGAGAMSKRCYAQGPGEDAQNQLRVERIPNPKDIASYIAKIEVVGEQKRALFGG